MTSVKHINPKTKTSLEKVYTEWYVRRGSTIQGPFPAHQIGRYLLLGRVRLSDWISVEGDHWISLSEVSELVPEEMHDLESDAGKARFLEARQRADERSRRDQRRLEGHDPEQDRRQHSDLQEVEHIRLLTQQGAIPTHNNTRLSHPVFVMGGVMILVLTVALAVAVWRANNQLIAEGEPDCAAKAQAAVNWSYCVKDGADLSAQNLRGASLRNISARNANLQGAELNSADLSYGKLSGSSLVSAALKSARLVGADLQRVNFTGADLSSADLSYANLIGATLEGADLSEARLVDAVWTNGHECLEGSVGRCVQ